MVAGQLGQTVTVINKSGKVVSNSKQLINVLKEARSAYRERKAEIRAHRHAEAEEKRVRLALDQFEFDDKASHASSRASHKSHKSHKSKSRKERPPVERGVTDSFYINDDQETRIASPKKAGKDLAKQVQQRELARRHSDGGREVSLRRSIRSNSDSQIDMDLAYGELPPPLPEQKSVEKAELREKMSKLTMLLDEANCIQHSATTTIENLQKNPEALAAVALTLAEISNLASKMAPGVLMSLKGTFPAAVALLASPQFMIAAGVGVGVTIVALGGYKIIKKIKEKKENETEEPLELGELQENELSRIELWRRGIADVHASSAGTSVDGELITPAAENQLISEGVLDADDAKSRHTTRTSRSKSKKAPKTSKSVKTTKQSHSSKNRRDSKQDEIEKIKDGKDSSRMKAMLKHLA